MLIFVAKIALRPLQCDYMHIVPTPPPFCTDAAVQRYYMYARYHDGELHIIIIYT